MLVVIIINENKTYTHIIFNISMLCLKYQYHIKTSWEQLYDGRPVLSMLFVFWWDIAGLPNTQLIIPLIIHNVEDYSDENKSIPTAYSHFFSFLLSLCSWF